MCGMELIDGNAIADSIINELTERVAKCRGAKPGIGLVRVGDDPASVSYVRKKEMTAARIGIESTMRILPQDASEDELFDAIDELNDDDSVHGILVQSPIPCSPEESTVFNRIAPWKDVDGLGAANLGYLAQDRREGFVPCTPCGIIEMLKRSGVETSGKHAVVLGRSQLVGKPISLLLAQKADHGNATVTLCHSRTANIPEIVATADILIAAIGKPAFVRGDWIKEGAVVIDVGINAVPDPTKKSGRRLVGDVDFEAAKERASKITPVPGGVGPMTVAMLMANTVRAFDLARSG